MKTNHYLRPYWPAPQNIRAVTTTKHCGNMLNTNMRKELAQDLQLPNEPIWLEQVHENTVICADSPKSIIADASYTSKPNIICVVRTADCLPILLCNKNGTEVAAIHGGWRSLSKNIIENTIKSLKTKPKDLLVWLGPAIGPEHFEVGEDVYNSFSEYHSAFMPTQDQHWQTNIYEIAKQILQKCKINGKNIYGGHFCTYTEEQTFYSYRRDGKTTGRMASLIWIER